MTTKYTEHKAEEYEIISEFEETEKSFQDTMEEILLMIIKQL